MNTHSLRWKFFTKPYKILEKSSIQKFMKIIVLMKQVANKDAVLRVRGDEKWIDESNISQQTNESDGYALEEALRLKEAKGEGEVVVCTLGAQVAKTVLKDALARGADRAIHVVADNVNELSPYQIAKAIADAIRDDWNLQPRDVTALLLRARSRAWRWNDRDPASDRCRPQRASARHPVGRALCRAVEPGLPLPPRGHSSVGRARRLHRRGRRFESGWLHGDG